MPSPRPRNDYERKLVQNVAKYGWQCTSVEPAEGDSSPIRFSYTIGLHSTYGQPEFIIFGLPRAAAHGILDIVAKRSASGEPIDITRPSSDLVNDYECMFVPVPREQYSEYLVSAIWWEQGSSFPAIQIVWPSKSGLFPWHPSAHQEFKKLQPVLGGLPR